MDIARYMRHLCSNDGQVRRAFSQAALDRIEAAIGAAELRHLGEIRFAVEAGLDVKPLFADQTARERALEVFSCLRVWDTERNNGVLIYLLLAEHDVEIIADRGIDAQVGKPGWEAICQTMEKLLRAGRFEEGILAGIQAVSARLAKHFPKNSSDTNELPDVPVVL